ncbi:hypothetical protein GGI23_000234 [Coemansia sp. RSA 2559]|nr:hypothetical protein GGI23_000234 [Coemansia sp. RSA 2559]KAJ2869591.1 hypothetical protein GGI22_000154 [Coemansia erecta]
MPQVSNQNSDDSDCAAGSALYSGNSFLTRCTSATLPSIENDACSMPYGIMFKENRTDTVEVTHLYSHSVVYGNSMCDGKAKILSYYSSLWLYMGWMVRVLGRSMLVYTGDDVIYWNNTRIGWPTDVSLASPAGTITVSGDLYPVQRAMVAGTIFGSGSSSANLESGSNSDASESDIKMSSSISDDPTEKDNSSGISSYFSNAQDSRGLSKEAKIAIGVAVPVAVIIIAIVCAIGFKVWTSKDKPDDWDPQGEEAQLRTAALELFVEPPHTTTPPPYNRAHSYNEDVPQPEQTVEVKK